jgi:hypothetical protein
MINIFSLFPKWILRIFSGIIILLILALTYRLSEDANPYIYIWMELFIIFVFVLIRIKMSQNYKALIVSLATLALLFAISEAYFSGWFPINSTWTMLTLRQYESTRNEKKYFRYDESLGYAGGINVACKSQRYYGNELVYDITYHNNQFGLRVSPHDLENSYSSRGDECRNIIFFGCSFTVGQGLNDNETFPYLVEELSNGKFKTYNLGFHGYGPHQMLRALETGLLDKIVSDKKPCLAIYSALTDHVERSAGQYPHVIYHIDSPRYVVNNSGSVKYVGKFRDEGRVRVMTALNPFLAKSQLGEKIRLRQKLFNRARTQEDIRLFVGIIKRSQELFVAKYGGPFYVIFWSLPSSRDYDLILSELHKAKINIITTREIFKAKALPEKYRIRHDGHPNQLANREIARYLLDHLSAMTGKRNGREGNLAKSE